MTEKNQTNDSLVSDAEVIETTENQVQEEKFAYPLSLLEKDPKEQFAVNINMSVEYYNGLFILFNKFVYLDYIFKSGEIPLGQKATMLQNSFNEQEVDGIKQNLQSLLGAIAFNQAEVGFIEKMTEAEHEAKVAEISKQAEASVKEKVKDQKSKIVKPS